jgi:hypothetical protein
MEKEKKKKEIDKIIKKEITRENRKAQKKNQAERYEEKRKEKLSNVTTLTFANSEPEVKEKKKKKIENSTQIPSTLEQADQILTEEKLNSFIQHSKKLYPKEENLQINEVAEKIQYLYQNIRVKNEFRFPIFF